MWQCTWSEVVMKVAARLSGSRGIRTKRQTGLKISFLSTLFSGVSPSTIEAVGIPSWLALSKTKPSDPKSPKTSYLEFSILHIFYPLEVILECESSLTRLPLPSTLIRGLKADYNLGIFEDRSFNFDAAIKDCESIEYRRIKNNILPRLMD